MSYEVLLDPTVPGQGEFARLGAGRIRGLTKAVFERLGTLFVNPNADPITFKPEVMPVRMVTIEYTFPGPTVLAAGLSVTVDVPLVAPYDVLAAGAPVIANWVAPSTAAEAKALLQATAWHTLGQLHYDIHNKTAVGYTLTGLKVRLTALFPLQP